MEPLFIDAGGIELLVDPRSEKVVRFWSRFPDNTRHFLCPIVYWEYLRQFGPTGNSLARQRFVRRVESDCFEFLQFGKDEAEIAVSIYTGVKRLFPNTREGKLQLKDIHCDIMIAAIAVSNRKPVLTQDVGDWTKIKNAVEADRLGILRVIDRHDICD